MSILRPNRRKNRKRDGAYMAYIASLLCAVCFRVSWLEMLERGEVWRMGREYNCYTRNDANTEVAHVGDRGLGQKCPDRETIPLCVYHHREGPDAAHKLGKRFWERHGLDRDALIKTLQEAYWRTREQ